MRIENHGAARFGYEEQEPPEEPAREAAAAPTAEAKADTQAPPEVGRLLSEMAREHPPYRAEPQQAPQLPQPQAGEPVGAAAADAGSPGDSGESGSSEDHGDPGGRSPDQAFIDQHSARDRVPVSSAQLFAMQVQAERSAESGGSELLTGMRQDMERLAGLGRFGMGQGDMDYAQEIVIADLNRDIMNQQERESGAELPQLAPEALPPFEPIAAEIIALPEPGFTEPIADDLPDGLEDFHQLDAAEDTEEAVEADAAPAAEPPAPSPVADHAQGLRDLVVSARPPVGSALSLNLLTDSEGRYQIRLDGDTALLRNSQGQLLLSAAAHALGPLPEGWRLLAQAGQVLVGDHRGGLVLPAGSSAGDAQIAALLALPMAGLPTLSTALASEAMAVDSAGSLSRLLRIGGVGLTLALEPSSLGGGLTVESVGAHLRLLKPAADVLYGELQIRSIDEQGNEHWLRALDSNGQALMRSAEEAGRLPLAAVFETLSPEQIEQLQRPLIYLPAPVEPGGGLLPTPAQDPNDERSRTPGYGSVELQPRYELPGYDAQPPHWSDAVMSADGNADNNRERAALRQAQNPALADPRSLEGTPDKSGIGHWGYPGQPRGARDPALPTKGQDYQEQVSGKPYGLEFNVGGTPHTTAAGTPTSLGGSWFDDVRVEPGRIVLVDAKDWGSFVQASELRFWKESVEEQATGEIRSLRSAGLEGRAVVEWQVSTQEAADAIERALARLEGAALLVIRVVAKKGP